jgi:hypothetical protein
MNHFHSPYSLKNIGLIIEKIVKIVKPFLTRRHSALQGKRAKEHI